VTGVFVRYNVAENCIGSLIIVSDTENPFSTGYSGMEEVILLVSSMRASNSIPHTETGCNFLAI
jgi:hypothetical protein